MTRELGLALRQKRQDHQWTKAQLIMRIRTTAQRHGFSVPKDESISRRISSWENGHTRPDEFYLPLLCEIYGCSPDDLGYGGDEPDATADEATAALLLQLDTARNVDAALIEGMRMQTDIIRMKDRKLGAAVLADEMGAHLRQTSELLRFSVFRTEREGLAFVLADASALAGWQAIDTGSLHTSWEHFERAKSAAREAGDPTLLAFATAEQAYVLLELQRPQQAVELIQHAHHAERNRLPALMRAWLYAAEAEAHATLGDQSTALRTMDAAAGELPTEGSNPDFPYLALNLVHLARWRGNVLASLGDAQAIDDLSRALEGMGSGAFTRAEAGLHVDLAGALIANGDSAEARAHLKRARTLVEIAGSARQRRRVEQLTQRL
ncbi:helix-turn-helix transcriptional regulator [Streptomyces sp. TRM70308]|uniref:helix-turn-helix transcriptional regulator n=1 Tax=Streptomyces sp. TRM70308 TaxID=3131932 RepID=UPI003D083D9A